ncbi:Protein of unknown function (DUF3048) [Streptoalloteichus tenebrarius]|uniref:DUF3048 domain-containing protein n=1 Tax=Streptoalloteichus tenebrarius (strain ATCC 17920 / DSM 40477 / JCM 4838 / CBS 697.72 / NBRC 16177 / NCIMB 11028 / NRRL B-12390 / A12253. 1 / ISP 5477) TaxID=1933 RepID=A0ABT1I308_STRSD|nr:DUF3048 domain-containing protein [Streptoalloteichus tenebrarius]MCP2262157.1 Protein of unknown function (DUF3048) [Streptoalloteichus tenebrarius]BFF00040.1 DUF3048 domain-containing protein [Streptoalloteichus tenebrarius]
MGGHGLARIAGALVLAAGLLLASSPACTNEGGPRERPRQPATGSSPFTGEQAELDRPVLAVKVDVVPSARPPTGLDAADLVYVEPVEGGEVRLVAVFAARRPEVVGPVRSARESDIALLAQFGRPALAFSGSAPELDPALREASLVLLTEARTGRAFFRDSARVAPYNLYARPDELLSAAEEADASRPRDVGFRFGAAPRGGEPTSRRTVSYLGARVGFDWDSAAGRWGVSLDGTPLTLADDRRAEAATAVVQRVRVRRSSISDVAGYPSPIVETVGEGDAVVLRDGRAYEARWSRHEESAGTSFTLPSGEPALFAPGPVWIVLAPD